MSVAFLKDHHARVIDYLRISLTERCNFRCLYCMPPEGSPCKSSGEYLTADEITLFTEVACSLGVTRVRLTGGEPTLRGDVVDVVAKLARVPGLVDLAMTTNGSKLKELARPLVTAGLKRVNVSLDSLNPKTFARMALREKFDVTMDGLLAVLAQGIPVKVNTVVMRGINDGEIPDFIEFALANPVEEVRFIEFMPLCGTGWKPEFVRPFPELISGLARDYAMERIVRAPGDVAQSYLIRKGSRAARIGFITTLSEPFCATCSRMRLTADGVLRPCLFSHEGVPIRGLLRDGASREELAGAIRDAVLNKPKGNGFADARDRGQELSDYLAQPVDRSANPNIRSIGG